MKTDRGLRPAAALLVATSLWLAGCSSGEDAPAPGAYLVIPEEAEQQHATDPVLGYIRVVEMFSGEEVLRTEPVEGGAFPVWWAPDGRHIVTPANEPGGRLGIQVIDFPSGKVHGPEPVDLQVFGEPVWSPDGTRFAMSERALGVFDAKGRLLYEAGTTGPGADGSFALGLADWSPNGRRVVTTVNTTLYVGGRYAPLFNEDVAGIEVGDSRLPEGSWAASRASWQDDVTIEVFLIDRFRRSEPHWLFRAVGRVGDKGIMWTALEELSDTEAWIEPPATAPVVDLQAAVPDGDFSWDSSGAFPPFQTADGGSWVYQVPGGPKNRLWQTWPFAVKLVVFGGDRTGVVEVDRPLAVGLLGAGAGDVVVVPGDE